MTKFSPIQNPKSKIQNLPSLFSARAQAVVEYSILMGVVMAAVITMQTYAKRGIQAGIKVAADRIGSQRGGIIESSANIDWKVKGRSKVIAASTATTTSDAGGVHTTSTSTTSGTPAFSIGAERGQ